MTHHARPRFRALLAVCPAVFLATATAASAQPLAGTNGAPVPTLQWGACPADVAPAPYQCSVAEVPLAYRDPNGQSLELVLGKLPADQPGPEARDAVLEPRRPGRFRPAAVPVLGGLARALRPRRVRPARDRRLDAVAVLRLQRAGDPALRLGVADHARAGAGLRTADGARDGGVRPQRRPDPRPYEHGERGARPRPAAPGRRRPPAHLPRLLLRHRDRLLLRQPLPGQRPRAHARRRHRSGGVDHRPHARRGPAARRVPARLLPRRRPGADHVPL